MGLVHSHVAKTYACRGRLAEAEAEILRAGEIFAGLPRAMPYSAFLQYRLQVHDRCGRFKEALFDIAEGIAIANSVGDVDAYLWQLFRAEIHFGMGKPAEALRATEAVLTHLLLREDTYVREIIVAYANLARFRLAVADVDAGIASAREALLRTRRRDLEDLSAQAMHLAAVAATLRRETRVAAKLWCSLEVRYDPEIARAWRDRDRSSMPAALQAVAYQELETFRTGGLRQSRDAIVEEALEALEARPVSTATGTSNGVNS
jgi:tetratricopeptide (TPR) repeat protein